MTALNKQRLQLKSILIACAIMWCVLLLLNLYLILFKRTNIGLIVVCTSLVPTLLPLLISLNKVNAEIKLRNSGS